MDSIPQNVPLKHCNTCNQDRPATTECFFRNGKKGWYSVCKICRHDMSVARAAEKRANRPPKVRKNKKQPGMCKTCHIRQVEPGHLCDVCRGRAKQARDTLRQQVIAAYGGKCANCGEARAEFLAIDHINGGGHKHTTAIGSGFHMCYWLRKNGFPRDNFQLLCHNCNWAKWTSGISVEHWCNTLRLQVLAAYGGKCICCGESTPVFLTIDHVDGGGNAHRESIGGIGGTRLYIWLRRSGFPQTGFQLLCRNCNWAKFAYSVCPHQRETP